MKNPTHKDKLGNLYYLDGCQWVKIVNGMEVRFKSYNSIPKIKL